MSYQESDKVVVDLHQLAARLHVNPQRNAKTPAHGFKRNDPS
ncbi:hypothetical protein [Deinococcus hopiensis]|nr:hypothetical protein [Deinococcus hopiensis]